MNKAAMTEEEKTIFEDLQAKFRQQHPGLKLQPIKAADTREPSIACHVLLDREFLSLFKEET